MKKRVIVAGGGASGMMAAIAAAEHGAAVTILEKKEQVGKKLLRTGNGKCNYSNFYLTERNYRGHHPEFAGALVRRFHTEDLLRFFEANGMLSFAKDAYLYPSSERAETVVSTLKTRMDALHVVTVTNVNVLSVTKEEERFRVETSLGSFECDAVILAMGSEASVKDPNPHTAYEILRRFGHHVYPPLPALVPLYGNAGAEELWDGVRIQAAVSYGAVKETGELQLTSRGISGIPAFQVSHGAAEALSKGQKPVVLIDFLPHYDEESLVSFLQEAKLGGVPREVRDYLTGWLPKKLVFALSRQAEEVFRKSVRSCSYEEFVSIVGLIKHFSYEVTGFGPIAEAQVAQGGLDTQEVTENLESRLVPGLYVTGELLDIDGACGGYNLHFAFASGKIAGEEAAR
ncbi:MAG: aminoacetone oxidase family FAD-binding enzyme [Lachnospiraceae bacterium]|nr:aminoacetone oxidase family FAD-binding enzyme [Lachnospiraceae bacterium]